ncbi:MAG: 5'-methylthioadenosine/adenosylhomocysteine nucleosidase [Clostridia bacterium]|nr:5'-methylthioadenosine/adenosylhomocysteine nucleosidase [Clostridia bacterium]
MKTNKLIGVIGAMESETEKIKTLLTEKRLFTESGIEFVRGRLHGQDVIVAKSGIGKVNAAICTQIMIDKFSVDSIINTGVAGAIDKRLSVGDLIIGTTLVQHDFDVTAFGYSKGYMCTGKNPNEPTKYHSDKRLVNKIFRAAKTNLKDKRIITGIIASGDVFVSSSEDKEMLKEVFNASAVEMEGAAIAQTAAAVSVPFAVIRTVSDNADGEAEKSFDIFEKEAAEQSAYVINKFIESEAI